MLGGEGAAFVAYCCPSLVLVREDDDFLGLGGGEGEEVGSDVGDVSSTHDADVVLFEEGMKRLRGESGFSCFVVQLAIADATVEVTGLCVGPAVRTQRVGG